MTRVESGDAAKVRIIPPLVPLVTILLGVALHRQWPIPLHMPAPARYWLGGTVVLLAVLGLGLRSVILFRRSGQSELPWKPTPEIVDEGPYRFTRNPMYLQMVVVCMGFFVILSNAWILILTPVCAALLQRFAILPEEEYLERKFGDEYRDYTRRVRRWL
jgi:protein-S-isoprenylcysteine O-methyltransferase Ste14